ncbi:MAG TPA: hypothetical protein PLE99_00750 [Candidatus Thiothrix moscowensis]|uniref:hypothetical protein n=1 Tax=unclassified Thiothrix TaxID=2636184 RepID=UPI0025F9E3ED|nr:MULTISPECIES: hypothetical protein [unclassified Thiothrix]HRJ51264.1 hypothetical protein [Candidatus Thiothrix moscowensis]HRJ91681.1 hypothetical protein [Candidatus Thiothrix moscowensis]
MISYKSPITHINLHSFDDLSLKVAELETLLSVVNLGNIDQTASYLISAAERLANWLQADVEALHKAYGEQHGWYPTDTTTSQSNADKVEESA